MEVPPTYQQLPRTTTVPFPRVVQEHIVPIRNTNNPLEENQEPPPRVVTTDTITFKSGQASKPLHQQVVQIIPDDTNTTLSASTCYGVTYTLVPLVHKYNTRYLFLQGHILIENHVDTIIPYYPPLPPPPPHPPKETTTVCPERDDWTVVDNATYNVTPQPVIINTVILPYTDNKQE